MNDGGIRAEEHMSNEHDTHEPTGARLTEAQVAAIARRLDGTIDMLPSGRYAQDVGALLADRVALVAEVARLEAEAHGWQQVAVEEQRTREIAQERYGNALGVQSALQAENADLKRLLGQDVARAAQWERRALAAEAQVAAMRPLMEALAKITPYEAEDGDVYYCMGCHAESVYYDAFPHDNDCRIADAIVMVATWQTPTAPTPPRPTVVCLCGSTRFSQAFHDANLAETLAGRIVLSIGCDMRSDTEIFGDMSADDLTAVKQQLDDLHKRKIDLADEILVLNVGHYVGDSTRSEITYAQAHGKRIRWLEPVNAAPTPDEPADWPRRGVHRAWIPRNMTEDELYEAADRLNPAPTMPNNDDDPTPDAQEGGER